MRALLIWGKQISVTISKTEQIEKQLFLAFTGILLAVGALMVFSSSMTSLAGDSEQVYFQKHAFFLIISISAGFFASVVPSRYWMKFAPYVFLTTVLLLVAVLIPGVGHRVNGAQRWLRFGPISFQPSETAKLTVPLIVCWIRCKQDGDLKSSTFYGVLKISVLVSIPLGLILNEPDLGTTLFVAIVATISMFLSGVSLRYFITAGVAAIPALFGLVALKPYQLARIQGFIQTWTNPEEAPYQIRQSLTTLGVGGIEGTGLGRGWQKLSFLPEANTDFIFAVIGEELGLLGTIGVVTLWLGLYFSGLRLIKNARSSFESILATTLLTQLLLQAALNVAVVTAMVPPKGISHPLISYGGSNLVTSLIAIGMIISLTKGPTSQEVDTNTVYEIEDIPVEPDKLSAIPS